jgi:4-amino-4-deoxy-L-arabinose transferase-like glycosyltransferase
VRRFTTVHGLLIIVAVSAVLNFVTHDTAWPVMTPDSPSYVEPARNLVAGRGFSSLEPPTFAISKIPGYPLRQRPETFRVPGYPLFLSLIFMLGGGVFTVLAVQHLTNVAIAATLYLFVKSVTRSNAVTLTAALSFAIFPPSIWIANTIMSETLFSAMLLATVIAAYYAVVRGSIPFSIAAALLLGASVLTRPIATWLFLPLAAVLFLRARRRRVAVTIVFAIASQLLPMIWIARNKRVAGVAALSSIVNENLLFEWGAGVYVTENASHLYRLTALQQQLGFRTELIRAQKKLFLEAMEMARRDGVDPTAITSLQRSVYMRRLAMSILISHPIALAELILSAIVELQIVGPTWVVAHYGMDARDAQTWFMPMAILLLVLTVIGVRELWRLDRPLALMTGATIVYFTLLASTPETTIRYAVEFAPLDAIAFGAGAVAASRYARARASRKGINGPS